MNGELESTEHEARLYMFAEAIPQIVWVARADSSHFYFNRRWYDYTGLTREESVGRGWSVPLHPDDRAPSMARWELATRTGEPFETEYRVRAADGRYRWFLGRGLPQRGLQGAIVCWFGTCTDIDDQKRAQEEVRRSEERFRLLAQTIPQIVWMADAHGEVDYLNQRWLDYTGLTYEQGRGWGWLQVVHPDDREAGAREWAQTVEQGGALEIEQRLRRGSDGAYRWHLARGVPLRDETGAIVQWVGTTTDIDDQRRQAELLERLVRERTSELQRSNRELEEFASVASHDLQEPLRKIQAFSDRLQAKCGPVLGPQGKEYLERILNSVVRMRTLINDLLTFSRIATKARTFVPVDLEAMAREVVADLEGLIQQTGGQVELGPLPTIDADPLQMRQLFQNLIGNSLKFHRPGEPPIVRLRARSVPDPEGDDGGASGEPDSAWYEIAIEDNGIGFEEIYLDRIFQVFQRLHGRREYEGTGVGLAICRKVVERHQGRITARSTPGLGATFFVTLPAHPHDKDGIPHDERTKADHDPDGR